MDGSCLQGNEYVQGPSYITGRPSYIQMRHTGETHTDETQDVCKQYLTHKKCEQGFWFEVKVDVHF